MNIGFPVLIGDIGGTNARFAMITDALASQQTFDPLRINEFATLEEAIEAKVVGRTSLRPTTMMLAIATPLVGNVFRLTNGDWTIDPKAIVERFGLRSLVLFNDFSAQGLAALAMKDSDLVAIGDAGPLDSYPKVVIGPGTGLGIATVVKVDGKWTIIPGEGGHVDLGPRTDREMAIWPHLTKLNGRVSAELALSGQGLVNLYRAICGARNTATVLHDAASISKSGIEGDDPASRETLQLFFTLLARVAGDMALISLARGGIYITGGIVAKILPALQTGIFRTEFENKVPHQPIMRQIATLVVVNPLAALEGLAALARDPQAYSVQQSAHVFET